MSPLLTPAYWFTLSPMPFMPGVQRALLILFAGLFVAGLIVWVVELRAHTSKLMKRALGRTATHLGWTGIVGMLLWAFDYERLPLLSMRAFYLAWGIWLIIGVCFIVRYVWIEIPALEARNRERVEREKWLPKKK